MQKLLNKLLLCVISLLLAATACAATAEHKAPDNVVFGVYPVSLYNFDLANNSYNISFYAWWRTSDKNYDPTKSIEIVNANEYSHKFGAFTDLGNGQYNTYVHYYAKIHQQWNTKYFPFSRQFLEVRLEDFADINSVRFQPDLAQSRLHSELSLPGWKIVSMRLKKTTTDYATNFGNNSTPRGLYDRLTMIIEIKHIGMRIYLSYFIGYFMAALLAHLLFLMNSYPFPARATIFTSGIFAFIGNKYIIDQRLPLTTVFTLSDAIQSATFIVLFLAIFTSLFAEMTEDNKVKRRIISWSIGGVSLFSYVTCYTYRAIIS